MIKLKAEMLKVLKMPVSNDIKFSGTSVKQDGSHQPECNTAGDNVKGHTGNGHELF